MQNLDQPSLPSKNEKKLNLFLLYFSLRRTAFLLNHSSLKQTFSHLIKFNVLSSFLVVNNGHKAEDFRCSDYIWRVLLHPNRLTTVTRLRYVNKGNTTVEQGAINLE